jgi:hypothetical protein
MLELWDGTKMNSQVDDITTRNFVFCNLSYATILSHMQLFWSCMQHVQLHATCFSYIRQVAKDKISTSVSTCKLRKEGR